MSQSARCADEGCSQPRRQQEWPQGGTVRSYRWGLLAHKPFKPPLPARPQCGPLAAARADTATPGSDNQFILWRKDPDRTAAMNDHRSWKRPLEIRAWSQRPRRPPLPISRRYAVIVRCRAALPGRLTERLRSGRLLLAQAPVEGDLEIHVAAEWERLLFDSQNLTGNAVAMTYRSGLAAGTCAVDRPREGRFAGSATRPSDSPCPGTRPIERSMR